jgi:hypothetical protein
MPGIKNQTAIMITLYSQKIKQHRKTLLNFQVGNNLGGIINTYLIENDMFTFKVDVFIPPLVLLILQ